MSRGSRRRTNMVAPTASSGLVIVAGAIATHPIGGGGNTWAFLQYVLGFRNLGFDVLYVEELPPTGCFDAHWQPAPLEASYNARYLMRVARDFGFAERVALWSATDPRVGVGLSIDAVVSLARSAVGVVNLSGRLHQPDVLGAVPKRIYIDLDPAFTQIWQEVYGANMNLAGHDVHFTVGLCAGTDRWNAPTCGIDWKPTCPPVVLSEWTVSETPGDRYTTVADWRGYSPVEWQGRWYGQKSEEFLRILPLAARVGVPLELCLAIHPDEPDLPRLLAAGWHVVDPKIHAATPEEYRHYVGGSRGEFTVVKNGYRVGHTGWFSDRTACYLAAGRPAVVQDTGFSDVLPTGLGLLSFSTEDEAAAALAALEAAYEQHATAARELAVEWFDSGRVLQRILERSGL